VKLLLIAEDAIRLEPSAGPLVIESPTDDVQYSAFHMLGGALAYCTISVLHAWAGTAGLDPDDLALDVRWTFADDPHRVGAMKLAFQWPSLPANRLAAAERVAELCTVHATLTHPPELTILGAAGPNSAEKSP
jgi:uncharacterized OsmC-like protein